MRSKILLYGAIDILLPVVHAKCLLQLAGLCFQKCTIWLDVFELMALVGGEVEDAVARLLVRELCEREFTVNVSDARGATDVPDGQIADSGDCGERLLRVRGDTLFAFDARATLVTCGVNKIESIFRDVNRRTRVKVPCLVVGEEGAVGICTMCQLVGFGDPHCACLLQGCLVAQRPLMRRPVVVFFGNMGARSGGGLEVISLLGPLTHPLCP